MRAGALFWPPVVCALWSVLVMAKPSGISNRVGSGSTCFISLTTMVTVLLGDSDEEKAPASICRSLEHHLSTTLTGDLPANFPAADIYEACRQPRISMPSSIL